jgi:large subunit ribosomal protein L13
MKTVTANPQNETRKWWVIDAKDAVLGRLSTTAAKLLMGKHKASYHPAHDHGDFVVIINADKVALTGTKREDIRYFNHSQYPGGWRELTVAQAQSNRPGYPIRHAIHGMLPHTDLGRAIEKKLHIYDGENHPHAAQKPEPVKIR